MAWLHWDGSDNEIYTNFAGQLTNNSINEGSPAISGTNVVWEGNDGSDLTLSRPLSLFQDRVVEFGLVVREGAPCHC